MADPPPVRSDSSPRRSDHSRRSSDYSAGRRSEHETPSTGSVSIGSSMRPSVSFKDLSIRRGARACDVLRSFAVVLQDCKGSSETFEKSAPVLCLDVFVSHNWSTPRIRKFFALTLHFNYTRTVSVALVTSLLLGGLVFGGHLPVIPHWSPYSFIAPYALVTAYVLPNAVLLCGHDIVGRLGCVRLCEPMVFIDKMCIHQTDKELQRQGIESLTAFLHASAEVLIIYTEDYLLRLWTVYELATIIVIRPAPRIRVVTAQFSVFVFIWWASFFVFALLYVLLFSFDLQQTTEGALAVEPLLLGGVSPALLLLIVHLRLWAKERSQMHIAAHNFDIRSAQCTVAEDRRTVHCNVSILMHDFGFVPRTATEEDALDAFNALAQDLLPRHLDASFGITGVPYKHIVLMSSPIFALGIDAVSANLHLHPGVRWCLAEVTWYLAEVCMVVPLVLALCCWTTSLWLRLPRAWELLFLGVLWPTMLACCWLFNEFTLRLYSLGVRSWAGFAADAGVVCLLGVLVVLIYRPRRVGPEVQEQWKRLQLERTNSVVSARQYDSI